MWTRILSFLLSLVFLVFAQPDVSLFFSFLGTAFGYGLLWYALDPQKQPYLSWKQLFSLSFIWSLVVHGAHFSWMFADDYVGKCIYLVWFALTSLLAALFALFSCCVVYVVRKGYLKLIWCLPGIWVALEMCRFYYLLSGMSLDFLGWPITASAYGRQFGGFFGWAGESWITMAMGVSLYLALMRGSSFWKLWLGCLSLPYVLGGMHYEYLKHTLSTTQELRVAVIQPAFHCGLLGGEQGTLAWERLVGLASLVHKPIDLLVFPEVVVPFGLQNKVYPYHHSQKILAPLTQFKRKDAYLMNEDWMSALAEYFCCPVLVGLERCERVGPHIYLYNSAECCSQYGERVGYDKRILVPGGEYIPGGKLGWLFFKRYFPEYALTCRRLPGTRSGVFQVGGLPKLGVSICYEETFGCMLRRYKQEGAQCLVNLTNDGWYPSSRLPQVHFHHGILRNQELGMPCIRACHTGVTIVADALGRPIRGLPYETRRNKAAPGLLQVTLPIQNYPTLYSLWGDLPMILLAFLSVSRVGCYFGYRLLAKKEKG